MTHNPTVHRLGNTYLIFYTGSTYTGLMPTADQPLEKRQQQAMQSRANQCIGVAFADSPLGPWQRFDQPILSPRPGHWDALFTTNPAALIEDDGTVLLYYKSASGPDDKLMYGVAKAKAWDAEYQRVVDQPLFDFGEAHIEDAYVWREDGLFWMIFKDMTDQLTGEFHAGVQAVSKDGIHWELCQPPKAYSRTVVWDDGTTTTQGALERPQLLIEDGRPTHLFFATADGPGRARNANHTWTLAIPLKSPKTF